VNRDELTVWTLIALLFLSTVAIITWDRTRNIDIEDRHAVVRDVSSTEGVK